MKDLGYITNEQYQTAYANVENGLAFSKGTLPSSNVKSYFIQAAINEVVEDLVEENISQKNTQKPCIRWRIQNLYNSRKRCSRQNRISL